MSVLCSHPACPTRAVAQLMYDYASRRVEIGPLDQELDPNSYALCQVHLDRLKVPQGWAIVNRGAPRPVTLTSVQIEDLAKAVRCAGGIGEQQEADGTEFTLSGRANLVTLTQRAHLRVVADSAQYDTAQVG